MANQNNIRLEKKQVSYKIVTVCKFCKELLLFSWAPELKHLEHAKNVLRLENNVIIGMYRNRYYGLLSMLWIAIRAHGGLCPGLHYCTCPLRRIRARAFSSSWNRPRFLGRVSIVRPHHKSWFLRHRSDITLTSFSGRIFIFVQFVSFWSRFNHGG